MRKSLRCVNVNDFEEAVSDCYIDDGFSGYFRCIPKPSTEEDYDGDPIVKEATRYHVRPNPPPESSPAVGEDSSPGMYLQGLSREEMAVAFQKCRGLRAKLSIDRLAVRVGQNPQRDMKLVSSIAAKQAAA